MTDKALIGASKAALHLGVGRNLVRRWTEQGVIPFFRDPETGRPVYSRIALDEWQTHQGRMVAEKANAA